MNENNAKEWELLALTRMTCEDIEAHLNGVETKKYRKAMRNLTGDES